MADQDFYNKALTSLTNQVTAYNNSDRGENSFNPNDYAKSLVEDDIMPKIDSAVKSYLSLVAARSATASEIDVVEVSSLKFMGGVKQGERVKCTFLEDANLSSLVCARALLGGINSTIVPDFDTVTARNDDNQENVEDSVDEKAKLQQSVIRILWNGVVQSTNTQEKKNLKPSKVFGRDSLIVAYPFVRERLRRGVVEAQYLLKTEKPKESGESSSNQQQSTSNNESLGSFDNELLPPIPPPNNVDIDHWKAYYTEFGNLLTQACNDNRKDDVQEDDSKLLWSMDGGVQELKARRVRRTKRAENALVIEKDNADHSEQYGDVQSNS